MRTLSRVDGSALDFVLLLLLESLLKYFILRIESVAFLSQGGDELVEAV